MDKYFEFLARAKECRALAANARNENERKFLLRLAQEWEELAADRERKLRDE